MEILLRYLHFISIFLIFATLTAEHLLLKKELKRSEIARLARIDGLYGFAALVLLGAGFTLWLGGYGKPAEFYTLNWIFHTKLALFFLVGSYPSIPPFFFCAIEKVTQPR